MKKIYDQNLINKVKEKYKIDNYFSKKYEFIMIEYEQGETIINPLEKTSYIQFVVEGTLLISFIDQEGKQTIVSQSEELCILGDMEFVDDLNPMFFAEAKTKVKTLALSLKEDKESLNQDFQFLHTLLNSIASKLKQSSTNQFVYQSVEERFLYYMHYYCKGSLSSIEEATNYLHCSRRQLQRVLKKLCDEGRIIKEGKGKYKIKG
ncbi:MAG: Crp/Fnr family transcriptional regulator [Bacillota bacterium]|nr:Crp/Fnr family transcriptional regulator [Bacillota bacterium]